MLWIKYHQGKNIPYELYYPNYQTDRDECGNTALMLWIQYRQGENIPYEMYY